MWPITSRGSRRGRCLHIGRFTSSRRTTSKGRRVSTSVSSRVTCITHASSTAPSSHSPSSFRWSPSACCTERWSAGCWGRAWPAAAGGETVSRRSRRGPRDESHASSSSSSSSSPPVGYRCRFAAVCSFFHPRVWTFERKLNKNVLDFHRSQLTQIKIKVLSKP